MAKSDHEELGKYVFVDLDKVDLSDVRESGHLYGYSNDPMEIVKKIVRAHKDSVKGEEDGEEEGREK